LRGFSSFAVSVRQSCEHTFVKPDKRAEARRLRSERGMALRAIAEQLGVSKGSVSLWVRDIELTAEQQAELLAKNPALNGQMLGMRVRRERCRQRRIEAQEHGRALAREGDPVHRGGCMLYWAEGSKGRNTVQLVNADAGLLATFLTFLRICYAVPDDAVTFSVNCFLGNGVTLEQIQHWWLARLAASTQLPATGGRQPAVVGVETTQGQRAAIRDRAAPCPLHLHRPEHLRRDPGVRRDRPSGVARSLGGPSGTRTQNHGINLPHRLSPATRATGAGLRSGPSLHPRPVPLGWAAYGL
jgi:transposase-like protein